MLVLHFFGALFIVHVFVLCFVTCRSNLFEKIAFQNISEKVLNVFSRLVVVKQTSRIAGRTAEKSAPFSALWLSSWKSLGELMADFPADN